MAIVVFKSIDANRILDQSFAKNAKAAKEDFVPLGALGGLFALGDEL